MNLRLHKYLLLAILPVLALSITVPAQAQLPPLPVDSRIQKGTLPCGVTYYMVTDPAEKGYADIAVVQRDEPLSREKRDGLNSAFLGRMGIAPGPEGFVSDVDGSTVYRFGHIPFFKADVLDSTLLFSFARLAASRAQQAIIVSGDIDVIELKKKLDVFSMLVPRVLVKEAHRPDYVWEPSPAPVVYSRPDGEAEVAVTYSSSRIPFVLMNTAQAIVTDIFGTEFQVLLRHRLEKNLQDARIPYGEIGFRTLRSVDYGGDERYTVYIRVSQKQLDPAMRVLSETMGEMDSFGVAMDEFVEAKQVIFPSLRRWAAAMSSAGEYVNRCIANFLYGAHLAPNEEYLHYYSRKNVPDSLERRLFNRFSSALMSQLSNFTLEYSGAPDSLDRDDALFYYNLAYLYGSVALSGKDFAWHSADTSALQFNCPKIRIKNEKAEAVTGGLIWTLSNGMRVVFKQVKGSRTFTYSLQLNGGLAQIPQLQEGEGGHIGHLLSLCDVAGMPAASFRDMLAANGISMKTSVSLTSMDISGSAPSDRLTLLLKAFLGMANRRTMNASEFQFYSQQQGITGEDLESTLFGKLNPGYAYSPYKRASALTAETCQKAETYFEDRFSRMNDGVLIISGDLSEDGVKKALQRYMGGFRTMRGTVVRRPVEMRTLSGVSTYTGTASRPGFHVLMDMEYSMTTEHFYDAQVAVEALRTSLTEHLAGYGYRADVRLLYCVQPQERFQVLVSCLPVPLEGLPVDVTEVSGERALTAVRAAIRAAAGNNVDAVSLEAWKKKLEAQVRAYLATPDGFTATLLARYSLNKDITSRYQEAISSCNQERVREFLTALAAGGRIEYIVQ